MAGVKDGPLTVERALVLVSESADRARGEALESRGPADVFFVAINAPGKDFVYKATVRLCG